MKGYICAESKENEAAAWRYIDQVCNEALGKYPTTLEQDEYLLAQDQQ